MLVAIPHVTENFPASLAHKSVFMVHIHLTSNLVQRHVNGILSHRPHQNLGEIDHNWCNHILMTPYESHQLSVIFGLETTFRMPSADLRIHKIVMMNDIPLLSVV